jgi:hypothetical protein
MRAMGLITGGLLLGTFSIVACGTSDGDKDNQASTENVAGETGSDDCGKSGSAGSPAQGGRGGSATGGGGSQAGAENAGSGGEGGDNGQLPFAPSNVPNVAGDGVGALVLSDQNCIIDTDEGTISCADDGAFSFSEVEQLDGPTLAVFAMKSLVIEQSAQVAVHGSRPLVILALDTIEVRGGLDATATREARGGGFAQTPTGKGGSPGGGAATRNFSAGGGGAFCGKGGSGGFATDDPPASKGGTPFGNAELVPLFGGAAGGGAPNDLDGGAGGGAIELVAGNSILIGSGGYVSVGGGGGAANGGGAGSGGAVLIEAPSVTVNGVIAANGGGGAIYNGGASGQPGQPDDTTALGSTSTAGHGSAGETIDGGDGSNDDVSRNSSGGGGGGAGRIRINSSSGKATFGANSIVSPALTTECVSEGKLE